MKTKEDILETKEGDCKACKIRKCLAKIATRMTCKGFEGIMIREARELLNIVDGEYQDI